MTKTPPSSHWLKHKTSSRTALLFAFDAASKRTLTFELMLIVFLYANHRKRNYERLTNKTKKPKKKHAKKTQV